MGRELFLDFFTEHEVPVIRKRRHTFLKMDDDNVYILKEGVVKVSVLMRDGREYNITYAKGPDLLSLMCDTLREDVAYRIRIRVESEEASFCLVSREDFSRAVKRDEKLKEYVEAYYRENLQRALYRQKCMTMNGKSGAIYGFLYNLISLFGKENEEGILIDMQVTNDDIAGFCGISTRNSVNRILRGLREENVIRIVDNKILILNADYLKPYAD
jgi:CRP-like cAMP-binding protein